MKNFYKKIFYLLFVLIFLATFIYIYIIWPHYFVEIIWVQNVYILIFFLSIIWWVFFLTAASFYATLATFIIAWIDIFSISIVAAIWLTIGDLFFYFLWKKSRILFKDTNLSKKIKNFSNWILNKSDRSIFIFLILYWSFAPLPNDIPSSWLWIAKYPLNKIILPIFIWNINYNLMIWFLALAWFKLYTI